MSLLKRKKPPQYNLPHFRDGKFRNTQKTESKSLWEALRMRFRTPYATWPKWVRTPVIKTDATQENTITYINHASFLIQVDGHTILTDPVYAHRVGPFNLIGPKRVHAPAIAFDALPKIDVVLISHNHYDHLDTKMLAKLIDRDHPKIYTGLGVGKDIKNQEHLVEMDWWQRIEAAKGLHLTFTEAQHFSGRSLRDHNQTLWGAFLIEANGSKIYFGGDSGYGDHYRRTYQKLGAIDVALLPIGAYAPKSFMQAIHMDPYDAIQAHLDLHANVSIGMHFGTFQLTAESREDPILQLEKGKKAAGLDEKAFITLKLGQPFAIA